MADTTCPECGGDGRVVVSVASDGRSYTDCACPTCFGTGKWGVPDNKPLTACLEIARLAATWNADKLGDISLQRRRWQRLGRIARDAALGLAQPAPAQGKGNRKGS